MVGAAKLCIYKTVMEPGSSKIGGQTVFHFVLSEDSDSQGPLTALARLSDILIKKLFTDAAHTPETLRKRFTITLPSRYPYCNICTTATLHHLTWTCYTFTSFRNFTAPSIRALHGPDFKARAWPWLPL